MSLRVLGTENTVLFLFKSMDNLLGRGLLGGDRENPFGDMDGKKNFRRASRGGMYGIRVFSRGSGAPVRTAGWRFF